MELRDKKGLTEAEFLAAYAQKHYPKPAATADIAVFGQDEDALRLLLVRRGGHPYLGRWALPGGFANPNEPLEATAARELAEETGLTGLPLAPVGVFSAPGRDPRGWVISSAYTALVPRQQLQGLLQATCAGDDAASAAWFAVRLLRVKQHDAADGTALPAGTGAAGVLQLEGAGTLLTVPCVQCTRFAPTGPQQSWIARPAVPPESGLAFDHGQIVLCALEALGRL